MTKPHVRLSQSLTLFAIVALISWNLSSYGADEAVLKPRVPIDQIETVKTWTNPLPATGDTIEKGKRLFHGKAFCVTCHGKDGKGLGADIEPGTLRGPLPRNFTDQEWQAARTDGELFWILKNGSKGTAMAPFIPLILSEEEAWQVLRYVRSFGHPQD
ncbi:MAG: c-type cytochrome [Nitrospira sp.]|jgi:mono/diheme cytochrome c family protein|nr:c-type cytochrome [Nitrospira sp.]MDH4242882.1 c-type cytochrome [Nitrospira sp.]MDH5318108.1 c-type cytochrome [Nitrospira sp.]